MRTSSFLLAQALALFGSLGLAAPMIAPTDGDALAGISVGRDVPRAVNGIPPGRLPATAAKCVNPPKATAGARGIPHRRDLDQVSGINRRAVTDLGFWCVSNNRVSVRVIVTRALYGIAVPMLLAEAQGAVIDSMLRPDYGIILPTGFDWKATNGLRIRVWQINSYRLTWGILRAALTATYAAMMADKGGGVAVLRIFDGEIEVGRGLIG